MENFSYLKKPISECNDSELITWYIAFRNSGNMRNPRNKKEYQIFQKERANRDSEFNNEINYIDSVL